MKNFIVLTALVVFGGLSLTACNTVEGLGKDVEKAGEKIQEL